MPAPSNSNLFIGSFNVFVDLWVNGVKTGLWRHMGLVDKLALTATTESVKKKNTMDGARGTYKEVVTGSEMALALTFSEFTPENLALALGGSVTTWTQSSGTATDTAITGTIKKGYGLSVGKNRITVTAVKKGATTLVNAGSSNGTGDYWVEAESGTIFILDTTTTAGLVDGDSITWTGSYPAITAKPQVNGLTAGQIYCSIKAVSAANQASGPRKEILIPQASIMGDGAIDLISDDFATGTLKGTCLQDTTQPVGEQFYREKTIV